MRKLIQTSRTNIMTNAVHLSPEQVMKIISYIENTDFVVVGGQAVNLWAAHYSSASELNQYAPFTSKDIDFFGSKSVAEQLAVHLDGELLIPKDFDPTPNSAVVVGCLENRKIVVDFLRSVMGVADDSITANCVRLQGEDPITKAPIIVPMLNPIDCMRSRLANINSLHRHDNHTERQAMASLIIVREFINEMLSNSEEYSEQGLTDEARKARRVASDCLRDIEFVVKNECIAKSAFNDHGINPTVILEHFADDDRIPVEHRKKLIAPSIARLKEQFASYARRASALKQSPPKP